MELNQNQTLVALQELIEVVAKLRSPDGGCPWDLAQTPETLTPYVIEEAYEVVDAIKSGDKKCDRRRVRRFIITGGTASPNR